MYACMYVCIYVWKVIKYFMVVTPKSQMLSIRTTIILVRTITYEFSLEPCTDYCD